MPAACPKLRTSLINSLVGTQVSEPGPQKPPQEYLHCFAGASPLPVLPFLSSSLEVAIRVVFYSHNLLQTLTELEWPSAKRDSGRLLLKALLSY